MTKNNLWKLIVCVLLTLLIIPVLINIVYKIDIGIWLLQSEWNAGEMLSFYGAILSAVGTVLGVVYTIRNDYRLRSRENAILYKPILELVDINPNESKLRPSRTVGIGYQVSALKTNNEIGSDYFFEQQKSRNPQFVLWFRNVGRGETINTVVDSFEIVSIGWPDISNLHSNIGGKQFIGEIVQGGEFIVNMNLPTCLIMPKNQGDSLWFELRAELIISYSDMFAKHRYQRRYHFIFKVIVEDEETPAPYIRSDDYHYVSVIYEFLGVMPSKFVYSEKQNKFIELEDANVDDDFLKNSL